MRYTTVIDITSAPWYGNKNVVLLYVHMTMACGYHDEDRDLYTRSLRALARDSGITLSAVRHALHILQRDNMVTKEGNVWRVKKWIPADAQAINPRAKTEKARRARDAAAERKVQEERADAQRNQEKAEREELRNQGKTPYMLYYEAKVKEAEAGDLEAAEIVRKNRQVYENHKKEIEKNQKK